FTGHGKAVRAVVFHPSDNRVVASAGADGAVRIWRADTGDETLVLRGHVGSVRSVCFSPDGRRLASGGDDATIRIWDALTGLEVWSLGGQWDGVWQETVLGVAFSRGDGRRLYSVNLAEVRVWDATPRPRQ